MKLTFCVNAEMRDNGTFSLVRQAAKEVMGLPVFGLDGEHLEWLQRGHPIPEDHKTDMVLFCDDGRDDIPMELPDAPVKACWLIDTHLGSDIRVEWAKHFDFVFCAQTTGVDLMADHGIDAHWLPLACQPRAQPNQSELMQIREALLAQEADPAQRESAQASLQQIFMGRDLDKEWDVVFVGFMNKGVEGDPESHNRVEYLDAIFKAYRNSWLVTNCFHEAMAARYVKGRVGMHVSIKNDLAMRWFEIPSTGTAMLANRDVAGWADLGFRDGEHFVGYEGIDEAIEKIRRMLDNPMEREAIARQGHEFVRANHTYAHRMAQMFGICGIQIERQDNDQGAEGEGDAGVVEQDGGTVAPEPERDHSEAEGRVAESGAG